MARPSRATSGLLLVDKAAGMTSHDVVAALRRVLGERRIGHAGTLDPDATGLLVVAVGRATRLLRFASGLDKSYEAEVVLGVETTTLDATGEVTARHDMSGVTLADVEAAAAELRGRSEQLAPMYSAVRVGGRRLYEAARAGEEVAREPRTVEITRLEVRLGPEPLVFALSLDCSSGTYVRAIAADLGTALGGGAHLRALRRTRVGRFSLAEAVALGDVAPAALRPTGELVAGLEPVEVDSELAREIANGRILPRARLGAAGAGPWAVRLHAGELLGVYEVHDAQRAKPLVVLVGPDELVDEADRGDR